MTDFSWQNWLRSSTNLFNKRAARKSVRPQIRQIEGLENRALLTANLPVAVDDPSFVTNEDQQLVVAIGDSIVNNDTDADGDDVDEAILSTGPTNGTLVLNPNGTFTYTPNANFNGTDSFTYFARDSVNAESSAVAATVTITVNSVEDAPVATPDSITVTEDTPFNDSLAGTDGDGDSLTFAAGATNPVNGAVIINGDGSFTYTPDLNFTGSDSFSFIVNDGTSDSTEATVTVTITAVNDAPVANAGTLSTTEDLAGNGVLTGSDVDGNSITFLPGAVTPTHGSVTINPDGTYSYTPTADFNGTDSFSFVTNDGTVNSAEAAISVTIAAAADAPVATDGTLTVVEDTLTNGTLTGTDPDGDSLTFAGGSVLPQHGTVTVNSNGTYTYTPAANFSGTDTFSFLVNDGTTNSAEGTITVTITAVNDAPVATTGTLTTAEDTPANGQLAGTDTEGSGLTFAAGTVLVQHGTVTINPDGSYTYTPDANFNGTDTFTFTANDGTALSAESIVNVTITAVNDAPVATPVSYTFAEDTVYGGILTGTDADGNPITFAAGTTTTAHGTVVTAANGFFIYTPNANYHGPDSFTFVVNDGTSNSAEATVSLTITPVNDAPVGTAASIETDINTAFNGTLSGTDVDAGDTLSFVGGSVVPAHGTILINPNGTYTYTPTNGYVGTDSFTFKVNDGTVDSAEVTVTVTVSPVNTAPTVTNGTGTVNENAVLNGSVSTLGSDVDSDPLTYVAVTQPAHGTLTLSPDGTFVYTPTANYSGTDSFTFKANDGDADSNVATFNITVAPVDSPLVVTLPGGPTQVGKNSEKVQIDAGAAVSDPDTTINYTNSRITVTVPGISSSDAQNGRITVAIRNQGTGAGLVKLKGSKIFFNGSSTAVATFTGGTKGRPLVITFTSAATEQAVNAVLKQITIQASKKATSGTYAVNYQFVAGSQTALASKNVVIA